ncbi:hypothetical protein N9545_05790 [Salibacteraceae bacterium]|jgi:hypothetical protein|nr:hypothetical protein [Salibacteraceae bacterium]MDB4105021.1 hypothetical protein [Salibacteraceae bacterium]MDB9708736.1 hypothetical protein [Salibacteraceae bacterium]HAQ69435.1 hypothetical protein [Flavobacteriales bacterium]
MEERSRDTVVTEIRPLLSLQPTKGEIEGFQNEVMRPILKFQNELLILLAKQYVNKYHKSFNALKQVNQESIIIQASKQDPEFKSFLIWPVVGLMSSTELAFYSAHRSELNKRISTMAAQRIVSQLERLY